MPLIHPRSCIVFSGVLLALIVSDASATRAHHSTAAYQTKTITLKAIVNRVVWANPHCVIWFDVKDERGRVTSWGAEGGSPSALTRVGWHRTSLKAGDAVTVEVFPAQNGAQVGRLARVIMADGRELPDSLYKDSPFDTIQRK
jgi:hypothetical protein